MPIVARGGTDGATMVLFWPDNLPDNADHLLRDDPIALIESLDADGKLVLLPCDGDGGYTLAVYVREDLPPDLAAVCREHKRYPHLIVNRDGYFGGGEYVFKHDDAFLRKYPHMAEKVCLPAGTYAAEVFETDVPEGTYARWLRDRVRPAEKSLHDLHGGLAALGVVAVVAAAAGLFFLRRAASLALAPGAAIVVLAAVLVSRTAGYKAVRAAAEEFEGMYPDYVVRLTGLPGK